MGMFPSGLCRVTKVTGHWLCDICFGVSHVKWCVQLYYLWAFWLKKNKVNDVLWFYCWKALCHWIQIHWTLQYESQMRNCHSRTSSALGGLLGRLLLFRWQPPSFHLWDEALLGLDLPWTDSLLIGGEGLDVLEQDIDLCTLLLQIPLKHVRPQQR